MLTTESEYKGNVTYIMYCIVDHFERWLLVVVVHAAVAMENGHALLLCPLTVAAVHAVIRPVVPLAWKDEETLWGRTETLVSCVNNPDTANACRWMTCLLR